MFQGVLYHWRRHENSTALALEAKPYAMRSGEKALCHYFTRNGINAKVKTLKDGYRIRYVLPDTLPKVSIVILARNAGSRLRKCLHSVFDKTHYPNYEIIVVGNLSDDQDILRYGQEFAMDDRVRVLSQKREWNYPAYLNNAVTQAQGMYVGFLDDSIEVISPYWLEEMVSLAIQPGVGAVGAKLIFPNNTIQSGGVLLGIGGWGLGMPIKPGRKIVGDIWGVYLSFRIILLSLELVSS